MKLLCIGGPLTGKWVNVSASVQTLTCDGMFTYKRNGNVMELEGRNEERSGIL